MSKNTLRPDELVKLEKPARYVGGEINSIVKDKNEVDVRFALAFPDLYEIGMSHLGSKILYELVNSLEWASLERVFAPWQDLENLLRSSGRQLTTLETESALSEFDFIGFSLQYELSYSNIINMLDLGGITLFSKDRQEVEPLIIAGGPGAFNPEPIADFLDIVVLGDAEEVLPKLLQLYRQFKKEGYQKHDYLRAVASLDGIYVPAFYEPTYDELGTFQGLSTLNEVANMPVRRAIVADLNTVKPSCAPLLPFIEIVHDRAMLELFRGCSNGCRFCQAGILYRPVRERSKEQLLDLAEQLVKGTGHEEIALTSLSSMDYTVLEDLVDQLLEKYAPQGIGLGLSSLRVDSFSIDLAKKVQKVRKSGLTLAPEAGSQRMRDKINKNISEEQIITALSSAFAAGWNSLKLYFMLGLPEEEEEDVQAIVTLVKQIVDLYRQGKPKRRLRLSVSVSPFVPKPHTAYQWYGQVSLADIASKQQLLHRGLSVINGVDFSSHDRQTSFLEAAFSRGDRKLSSVIYEAWQRGARFDGWSECFKPHVWQESFMACGLSATTYAEQHFADNAPLPWDHLDSGVSKQWLLREKAKASSVLITEDCRYGNCSACGICPSYGVSNLFAGEVKNERKSNN